MKKKFLKGVLTLYLSVLFVVSQINISFGDFDVGLINSYANSKGDVDINSIPGTLYQYKYIDMLISGNTMYLRYLRTINTSGFKDVSNKLPEDVGFDVNSIENIILLEGSEIPGHFIQSCVNCKYVEFPNNPVYVNSYINNSIRIERFEWNNVETLNMPEGCWLKGNANIHLPKLKQLVFNEGYDTLSAGVRFSTLNNIEDIHIYSRESEINVTIPSSNVDYSIHIHPSVDKVYIGYDYYDNIIIYDRDSLLKIYSSNKKYLNKYAYDYTNSKYVTYIGSDIESTKIDVRVRHISGDNTREIDLPVNKSAVRYNTSTGKYESFTSSTGKGVLSEEYPCYYSSVGNNNNILYIAVDDNFVKENYDIDGIEEVSFKDGVLNIKNVTNQYNEVIKPWDFVDDLVTEINIYGDICPVSFIHSLFGYSDFTRLETVNVPQAKVSFNGQQYETHTIYFKNLPKSLRILNTPYWSNAHNSFNPPRYGLLHDYGHDNLEELHFGYLYDSVYSNQSYITETSFSDKFPKLKRLYLTDVLRVYTGSKDPGRFRFDNGYEVFVGSLRYTCSNSQSSAIVYLPSLYYSGTDTIAGECKYINPKRTTSTGDISCEKLLIDTECYKFKKLASGEISNVFITSNGSVNSIDSVNNLYYLGENLQFNENIGFENVYCLPGSNVQNYCDKNQIAYNLIYATPVLIDNKYSINLNDDSSISVIVNYGINTDSSNIQELGELIADTVTSVKINGIECLNSPAKTIDVDLDCTGINKLPSGTYTMQATFDTGDISSCNVEIISSNNKTLESISFSGVKQEYTIGDEVDKTGKYILHYSDGTTEEHDIPVDKFDGITTDAEKTYTLIIEQDGVSGQIEISVNRPNKVASSIAVTGVTKNYEIGDIFDSKGKIVISYTDGTSNEVELLESMISGFDTSEAGLVTVTVTYNGLTTTFDINVKEASGGTQPPTEESKPPVALTTLTYEFYKDYPDDVIIPLQMNDATDVTVVKVGSETLTENDYELVDSAIVLKKEFLNNLEEAKHWVRLTFNDKANTVVSNIILQVYDELGSSEKPVLLYKRIVYDGNQLELPFVSGTGDYEAHDVDALIVDGTIYLPNGLEMPYSKSLVNEIALMRTYIEEDNDILYNDYEEDIIDEEDEYYETATPSNARRVATASNAVKKSSAAKRLTSRQQDIVDALTVDDSGRVFTVENDTIIVDNDWFESLGIEEDNNYLLGAVFSNNDKTVDDKKVVISVPKGYDNSGSGNGEQKPPTGDGEQKPPTGGDEGTEKPPTGGDEGTEKPPTGGDGSGTEKPPTGDGSETEKPPTGDGGNQGTTKPPTGEGDGGNQGTTKPPTGEGDGSTTKPPTGDGNGSTGNPPIDDGNHGTTNPPTGDDSTNSPSGGNNSGTNTDGNNGGQNSGSNTPNRRPSHSSGGSGGSSSSTSNKTSVNPTVNSDGSLNTGYRPSVPNNGGNFVLDTNGNKVYKFPDGSIPLSTWVGDGENWYYQNKDGFIETGWFLDNDGSWYMLCKEDGDNYGAMLCGWYYEEADGKWYFLSPIDGHMLIGWQFINHEWYYMTEVNNGQTYFGDNINGWLYDTTKVWKPFGSMWCDEVTPDNYKVNTTGAWVQ